MKHIIIVMALIVPSTILAQNNLRLNHFNLEDKVAIQGYDAVAYFKSGKAIEGKEDIEYVFDGIPYRFRNAENLQTFKSDPTKYEPAYGGWCAYAMGASGDKVKVDPETFKIIDGKLNLFYNFFFNNTLKDWNKDEDKLKSAADNNWAMTYKE